MTTTTTAIEAKQAEEVETTYRIPEQNLGKLDRKIKKLARRAVRLGKPEPGYEIIDTVEEPVHGEPYPVYNESGAIIRYDRPVIRVKVYKVIRLLNATFQIEGWRFVASVQHTEAGNIIRHVPGANDVEIPIEYRNGDATCDHCGYSRRRNDTFAIQHVETGEFKRVGRNCLADFLGHDAANAANAASYIRDLVRMMEDEGFYGWGGGSVHYDHASFLTLVAYSIRADGWLSRGAARGGMGLATSDHAWYLMTPPTPLPRDWVEPEIHGIDVELATDALTWVRDLSDEETRRSEYLHNLRVACNASLTHREAGIVASAVAAYNRAQERELQRRQREEQRAQLVSEWIADKGDKFGRKLSKKDKDNGRTAYPALTAEITMIRYIETQWGGSTLIKFVTDDGRVVSWFASDTPYFGTNGEARRIRQGDKVTIIATVKRCSKYRGLKETQLSRCVLTPA